MRNTLPLIPLRELVAFPGTAFQILVGREKSLQALHLAVHVPSSAGKMVFLSVQKDQKSLNPMPTEISKVGIVARILETGVNSNGSYRVMLQGLFRARIVKFKETETCYEVEFEKLVSSVEDREKLSEYNQKLLQMFERYARLRNFRAQKILSRLRNELSEEVVDVVLSFIDIPISIKQELLEELNVNKRLLKAIKIMKNDLSDNLDEDNSGKFPYSSKNEYVNQDAKIYYKKFQKADLPENVKKSAFEELEKYAMTPPFSAESTVSRNYLDWLLSIPWKVYKKDKVKLKKAKEILEAEHYGLKEVKERVLDYLAVRELSKKNSGEIICLVGPPGVGKSSLAKSISKAVNKDFVRISLGGLRDEAEIRGHRRTYIGAYPGQIVKALKKAGSINPLILLDEIDKLASDFKGDPSSALLEVLDPEQNSDFVDHYMDLGIDLSKVFFITTANTRDTIPIPLLDRMEIIELRAYTEREKLEIAKKYLLPRQEVKSGLKLGSIEIDDDLILTIIREYTREAGVRTLERTLGICVRKTVRKLVESGIKKKELNRIKEIIDEKVLRDYLGIAKYVDSSMNKESDIGVATGLAWTVVGGDVLQVESRYTKGSGQVILTGRLGDVMKESSTTALSFVKLKLYQLGYDIDELRNKDVHIHIPEGAVPKEGPSAGITLAVALLSLFTGIAVNANFAMTGEITLRGKILGVGGIREKVLAAHRYGITNIIIPKANEKDYQEEIPQEVKEQLLVFMVDDIEEILDKVLEKQLKSVNIKSHLIKPIISNDIQ